MPQPGEVWLADIPFTSGAASKLRPVLVLWTDSADVVVAAITSAQPRSTTDVAWQNWSAGRFARGIHCQTVPTGLFGTTPSAPPFGRPCSDQHRPIEGRLGERNPTAILTRMSQRKL
jgi:hypothetical protein